MAAEVSKVEPAESEQDEEEDVYEVERIIDMRVEEGEVLYRVRWKNYCSDDDTWEPEAHLEDCREVLLAFKKAAIEAKAKKEAEAKKTVKVLPSKSDVFDADSESDSDKDRPTDAPIKKKKKKKVREEEEEEEPLLKEKKKKKKKKDKLKEEVKPLPAPETDEEEEKVPTPPSPPKERNAEPKKRVVESEEDDEELVPSKKHKKEKGKEALKHRKDKGEGKKKKGKKERKLETSEDEAVAPLEDDLSEGPSESQMDDAPLSDTLTKSEKVLEDKSRQKGKWEVKLQGIKDLIQEKKHFKKQDAAAKESGAPKQKSSASKSKEDVAQSDSSDSSTLQKKAKSKGQDGAAPSLKAVSSSASSASSSSSVTAAGAGKAKDEDLTKEELLAQKDAAGSTNLFEKFLLNCEAKDRAPRRPPAHPAVPEKGGGAAAAGSSSKPSKTGKPEKIPKSTKESPAQKAEPEKNKQSDVSRGGQSHGFSLDSDEKEDPSAKPKPGDDSRERRDRPEEAQRLGWERRTSADDRKKRREDSEPRLFIACDDVQEPPESAEKSDKGQTTLSLGMDLNLDWMTLDDFQKHLNGEDEILSGPPLSPSELRDAVKSGDYMAVKLALNSKEDYNLDQEGCTIGVKRSFEGERSLIEERSSSSSLRLTSNFDSARNEEFTPKEKEMFLQELDGLKNENKLPSYPVSTNAGQVTDSELESIEKVLNDMTESAAYGSATKNEGQVTEVQEETEKDKMSGDSKGDFILNIDNSDLIGKVEQNSAKEANDLSDETENAEAANSSSADLLPAESGSKGVDKGLLRRQKKSLEKRHPTRSSQRTCKKVIEILPEVSVDDEEKESSRKHYCLYCKMAFVQLAKHLEKKHADETDVAHAIHFPKGSKVRQTLLDEIRIKGDYEHNCQSLKGVEVDVNKNEVKNPAVSVRDFLPCQHCFTFYRKTDLWRHEQSCKSRRGDPKVTENTQKQDGRGAVSQTLPMSEILTESCKEIIQIMHQDEISTHIRSDPLICKYGNALSAKYDHDKSQFAYIAQKMRELGRFVLAVNEIDKSVKYLHEVCLPSKFGLAVEGVKKLSGFDPGSSRFKTISLVSKLGYSLKRAAEIAFGESRMTEDNEAETQLKKFIQLLDTKWNGCFSHNMPPLSPKQEVKKVEVDKSTVTEDLIKLYMFIMGEEDDARRELKESPSLSTWKKLSEATLADVCLFNRGRVGNIGRLLSKTYIHKKSSGAFLLSSDQIRKSTKLELDLGSSFTRLELEGQYGRNMLVLLSKGMVSSIDLLVENRERAGVSQTNPYLFARTEGPSFIRALDCFRRAAMECGVKNPEALLSSSLREQIACCWQLLSLNEGELDQVAKLVGRSSQECYMLSKHPSLLEEVSKQLLKMDRTSPRSHLNNAKDGNAQKPAVKRRPWSEKEQTAVKRGLNEFITSMKVPGKKECNACIAAEPDLEGRSWTDVKNYVHNTLQTMRRRSSQQKSERNTRVSNPKSPKAGVQTTRTNLENTILCNMTTIHPDHLRESSDCCMTLPTHAELRDSSLFTQEMTPTYASLCSTSTNMIHTSQPLVSSFTPLNATDTQVVPTFTPQNTTNAPMPPTYALDNSKLLPMSSLLTQISTTMSSPAVYAAQDSTVSPMIPSFTSLTAPSTSMVPTFAHLSPPSAPMIPAFPSLDDSSRPIVSSFTALNSSVSPAYPTSPPQVLTTAQVVPTIHGANVSDRAAVAQDSTAATPAGAQPSPDAKSQKRVKRLWSEEEQAAVRRQLGDFCKLVKVPGKKDCDACLAAEPALNTRTWREVKYFVHNSIQSLKRRGLVASKQSEPETETQNLSSDWDGPVYLSL